MFACALSLLALGGEIPPQRLEVFDGRASIADERGVEQLSASGGALLHEGPGYVEFGALARLDLRWSGCASVQVDGPARFEWRAAQRAPGGLYIEWFGLHSAQIEVRRGPVRMALPGGWLVTIERGAGWIRALSDGRIELAYDAGAPLLIARECDGGGVRPPWTVLPGARVRLACGAGAPQASGGQSAQRVLGTWVRPEPQALESARSGGAWPQFSWPWADELEPRPAVVGAPQPSASAPLELPDVVAEPPAAGAAGRRERALRLTPWGLRWE